MADDEDGFDFRPKKPSAKPLATVAGSAQTTSASFQTVSLEEGERQADEADPSALAARAWSSSGAFIQFADDDDSGSESGYSEASTVMRRFSVGSWHSLQLADFDDSRSESGYLEAFKKLSVQKAVQLYINELHEKIIFQADNATLFAQTIKKHRGREEETIGPGLLLERRPSEVYGKDFSSWPAKKPILTSAATFGRTKIVLTLIEEFKCDINVKRAKDSNTALHLAAYYGHDETVDALLKMGADCLSSNIYGKSPQQAVQSGAQHWLKGEKKHKYEDPFFVCFRKTGRNPEHTKCDALLLAHIKHLEQQKQDPKKLGAPQADGGEAGSQANAFLNYLDQQKGGTAQAAGGGSMPTLGGPLDQAAGPGASASQPALARDENGRVRACIDRQSYRGTERLRASITELSEHEQQQARRRVNRLLDGTLSSITIAGDAIRFGPSGTRFKPRKAEIFLPIDQGLLEGLRELEVPFSVGVFRWNQGAGCWDESQRVEAGDATLDYIRAETESFSLYQAALVFAPVVAVGVVGAVLHRMATRSAAACGTSQEPASISDKIESSPAYFAAIGPVLAPREGQWEGLDVVIYSKEGRDEAEKQMNDIMKGGHKRKYVPGKPFPLACRQDKYVVSLEVDETAQDLFESSSKPDYFHWTGDSTPTSACFAFTSKQEIQEVDGAHFCALARLTDVDGNIKFQTKLQTRIQTPTSTPLRGFYSPRQASAGSFESGVTDYCEGTASPVKRTDKCTVAVFPCKVGTDAQVHREGKMIAKYLEQWQVFHVKTDQYPSPDDFADCISRCSRDNIVGLHFAGHTNEGGEVVYEGKIHSSGREPMPEAFSHSRFVEQIRLGAESTLRLVFLNACESVHLGLQLAGCGVAYVVCWVNAVPDNRSLKFCKRFYKYLADNPGCYGRSFCSAASMMKNSQSTHPCLLWKDGVCGDPLDGQWVSRAGPEGALAWVDEKLVPLSEVEVRPLQSVLFQSEEDESDESGSEIGDEDEDGGEMRSLNNQKGKAEMEGFKTLGYELKFKGKSVEAGVMLFEQKELKESQDLAQYGLGFLKGHEGRLVIMSKAAVNDIFSTKGITYTDAMLWGAQGLLVKKAQGIRDFKFFHVSLAIQYFQISLDKRKKQGFKKGKGDSGHDHMVEMLQECVDALRKVLDECVDSLAAQMQDLSI